MRRPFGIRPVKTGADLRGPRPMKHGSDVTLERAQALQPWMNRLTVSRSVRRALMKRTILSARSGNPGTDSMLTAEAPPVGLPDVQPYGLALAPGSSLESEEGQGSRCILLGLGASGGLGRTRKLLKPWSGRRDSNPRRPAWEAGILPLNYSRSLMACKSMISQHIPIGRQDSQPEIPDSTNPQSRALFSREAPAGALLSGLKMDSKQMSLRRALSASVLACQGCAGSVMASLRGFRPHGVPQDRFGRDAA